MTYPPFATTNGHKVWEYKTIGEDMPTGALSADGRDFIFAGGDRYAYGIDVASGKSLWRMPVLGADAMSSVVEDHGLAIASTGLGLYWPILVKAFAERNGWLLDNSGWTWQSIQRRAMSNGSPIWSR